MIRFKESNRINYTYKPFYKRVGLYISISFIMVTLNFSALFHLINSDNGILKLREINHQIKRNEYDLNIIVKTNDALEDKILRFSNNSKDNLDLIDQVIRENLGYSSTFEKIYIFINPSNY
ncbi:MAG: hypothetical protein CBD28_001590 [Rhizobiales bacterium TMED168]|nr:MAG: hypothetical protein CBD28_001590 [Rhizobiales bacterium TMED168]|tara:strand:+ start:54203 stop:54565 length:363 start_codon:yes stop_codon:yes gene_type:complete